ncbi:MAG: hypothetical protein AAF357_10815, partial [Verrucomicrobiota bacterium]
MDLWFLFDRSASAQSMVDAGENEWKSLLVRSMPGRENRVHFIDYAEEVFPSANLESNIFSGSRAQTRTGLAINDSLARMEADRHHRILLFTDGFSTEPLDGVAEKLVNSEVPLDFRLLKAPAESDFRLAELILPSRTQPGEPFIVDLTIEGTVDGVVPVTVTRGNRLLVTKEIEVTDGVGRIRFSDRIVTPGSHQYRAVIEPKIDSHPGNNRREQWIEVVSGPRIVLVTRYEN